MPAFKKCEASLANGLRAVIGLGLVLLFASSIRTFAQGNEELSKLQFRSSNPALTASFEWAKRQALQYMYSGTGTIGPWYEAALPGRNAFCMRDVSHQTTGAAALGLFAANHNMLQRFAASAAASRNWAAYWEIDGDGHPSIADYRSDDDFWFNLPANFDVLDASVRMWRWTADRSYRDDPVFQTFFRETMTDYLSEWDLQAGSILSRQRILNRRLEKGKFVNSRGIPSYSEGTRDFTVGADLLAAEYRAIRSYAEIAASPEDKALSAKLQTQADELQRILESDAWSPQEHHFYGRLRSDKSGAGSADTLILYFGAVKNPDMMQGALDHVADPKYWQTINIEEESYVPTTLFRYGRSADAYKVLFDLTRNDKPRREYPEVSYAAIAAIVSGAMGIEPAGAEDGYDIRTLAQPLEATDDLAITSLQIRGNVIDVRHDGNASTTIVNRKGPAIRWKAEFFGNCEKMQANGRALHGVSGLLPGGIPICSSVVTVQAGHSATVTRGDASPSGKGS